MLSYFRVKYEYVLWHSSLTVHVIIERCEENYFQIYIILD